MDVILDSNFIISCIRKNIDFINLLELEGCTVAVPKEVLQELKDLRLTVSHADRTAIDTAFELLLVRKVKHIRLSGRTVDEGLIDRGKSGTFIATLDNGIRKLIPNTVSIRNASKDLVFEQRRP